MLGALYGAVGVGALLALTVVGVVGAVVTLGVPLLVPFAGL